MSPSTLENAGALVDRLVADLARGRVRSVAFVVAGDVTTTMPLYEVAIATARRGWQIGVDDIRYCFVTPEAEPASDAASQGLEPEGIAFIGSTYAEVSGGRVLLEPQGEIIEADVVVSLGDGDADGLGFDVSSRRVSAGPATIR